MFYLVVFPIVSHVHTVCFSQQIQDVDPPPPLPLMFVPQSETAAIQEATDDQNLDGILQPEFSAEGWMWRQSWPTSMSSDMTEDGFSEVADPRPPPTPQSCAFNPALSFNLSLFAAQNPDYSTQSAD